VARLDRSFYDEKMERVSHISLRDGLIKGWYRHTKSDSRFYCPNGMVKVLLCDLRPGSATYRQTAEVLSGSSDSIEVVRIPAGVAYAFEAQWGVAHLIQIVERGYDTRELKRFVLEDALR
jgi:dTDP-4-dehydrorhamnose 3,5-epimerase